MRKPKAMAKYESSKMDVTMDKKAGVKEMSRKDMKMDVGMMKKMGGKGRGRGK